MVDVGRDGVHTPARLLAGAHTMVVHNPGGRAELEQARPEWTILVPLGGHIDWCTGQCPVRRGAGVIFPPQVAYVASSSVGHISMFIDPWFQELGPGRHAAIALDSPTVEYLRALWSEVDVADLDTNARETMTYLRRRGVVPSAVALDPRVAAALQDLPAAEFIDHLAASVGLSPSRLRALIHDLAGMPPSRLRLWQRLRIAMLSLPDKPIALAAADAGFADQAHLTRTATRLLGQTPGQLARMLRSPEPNATTTAKPAVANTVCRGVRVVSRRDTQCAG